jgi:hypothetical protein
MVARAPEQDAGAMSSTLHDRPDVTACAHRLRLAADELHEYSGSSEVVPDLPTTIAHVEEALDLIAASVVRMSQAVADWSGRVVEVADFTALSPEARALRWHLHHVAAHLRSSSNACAVTRHCARDLLADDGAAPRDSAGAWGEDERRLQPRADFDAPTQPQG